MGSIFEGWITAGVEAFDRAAGVAAFFGVMAALGGLLGRSIEVLRGAREEETRNEAES